MGWRSSVVRGPMLEAFVEKGFLLPKEVAHWRVKGIVTPKRGVVTPLVF